MTLTEMANYIPHGVIVVFGAVVSWVYKDHVKRDDERFAEVKSDYDQLAQKIDSHFISTNEQLVDIALAVGARKTKV
jgi:hypothetical protein